jgi:hypothetical protein
MAGAAAARNHDERQNHDCPHGAIERRLRLVPNQQPLDISLRATYGLRSRAEYRLKSLPRQRAVRQASACECLEKSRNAHPGLSRRNGCG